MIYRKIIRPLREKLFFMLDLEERISLDSYALTFEGSLIELEQELYRMGYKRNPFAWLKTVEKGNFSEGSWVKRESIFSPYQTHITLEYLPSLREVDIYAHHEYNVFRHPIKHLREEYISVEKGVNIVKEDFEDVISDDRKSQNM